MNVYIKPQVSVAEGETLRLSQFLAATTYDDIPPAVIQRAKAFTLDLVGTILGGVPTIESRIATDHVRDLGGTEECTVIGRDFRTNAQNAAFVNSLTGHVLELDDTHRDSITHVGAPVIPAALAMAERQGQSGAAALAAVVLGYEACLRVACAVQPSHWYRGFLVMGTCGAFGSAAAAAHILGFDATTLANAFGLAGMYASSTNSSIYANGDMGKRLSPSHAAQSGISAALLAARGFTGSQNIFEGRNGFCMSFSDKYDLSRITSNLGGEYEIMRTSMKPYSCCRYNHAAIDGLTAIMARHGLSPADIAAIRIQIYHAAVVSRHHRAVPFTLFDAQMSIPFSLAVAALEGGVGHREFHEGLIHSRPHQEFASRVTVEVDDAMTAQFPGEWPTRTVVTTTDGRTFECHVPHPKGEPEAFMTDAEIDRKFMDLATLCVPQARASAVIEEVRGLENSPDLSRLMALLRADR